MVNVSVVKGDWTNLMRSEMWECAWITSGVMQGKRDVGKEWNDDGKGTG